VKEDILIGRARGIHHLVGEEIQREISVIQRMRIERGQMVHPDSVRPQQTAGFTHHRTAPAVADQMQWQLTQGVAVQFGNEIGAAQHRVQHAGDLIGIVSLAVRELAPIESDEDLAGIRGGGRSAPEPRPRRTITAPIRNEINFVKRIVGSGKPAVTGDFAGHVCDPTVNGAIQTMCDNRHTGSTGGVRPKTGQKDCPKKFHHLPVP
jgi:hypothetical protein